MNNPFVLLRILVLLDIILIVVGVIIPDFKDDSLMDYIIGIKDLEPNRVNPGRHVAYKYVVFIRVVDWSCYV